MKLGTGLGLLALGVAGLAFWAQGHQASRIETGLAAAAAPFAAASVHGATITVMGRDIDVSGIIDGPDERGTLLASLDALPGRRVVRFEQAQVLDKVTPFSASLSKAEDRAMTASGHVPSEAFRATLSAAGAADSVSGMTLAAGAPAAFSDLALAGAGALQTMISGDAQVTDAAMTLTGKVLGPDEAAAVQAALAGLAPGMVTTQIEMLDDGTPAAYELSYSAGEGATLTGKLPKGLDIPSIAGALGLSGIAGEAKTAFLGAAGNLAEFGLFQSLLPMVETLTLTASPEGRQVHIGVNGAIDAAALKSKLDTDLAGATVTVSTVTSTGTNGDIRTNAATGAEERFMGGYWVKVPVIEVGLASCTAASDTFLSGATITFLSGSDALDGSAISVINQLAGIMARCVEAGSLKATIGGHTDNQGDPAANLGLSQRRATAVRRELIARGVPGNALVAIGFGDANPVADNATDEGRALNRRTSIAWGQ